MAAARISVYSDASVHYDGVIYPDVAALLVRLGEQIASPNPPALLLAAEAPVDYEAVGKVIYGAMRLGYRDGMLEVNEGEAVEPRPKA